MDDRNEVASRSPGECPKTKDGLIPELAARHDVKLQSGTFLEGRKRQREGRPFHGQSTTSSDGLLDEAAVAKAFLPAREREVPGQVKSPARSNFTEVVTKPMRTIRHFTNYERRPSK